MKRATTAAETNEIDVFALPVHPWAAQFPMRSDEDLDVMAEGIKVDGLLVPVVLGMAVTAEGFPAQMAVIDGRNRIEACRRAGVTPAYRVLNGEDQRAFILRINIDRRDLSKGQKAMLVAVGYPDGPRGRGNVDPAKELVSSSFSRVKQARMVLKFCSEMVDAVIAGSKGLDDAYVEAQRRRAASQSDDARYEALRANDPDLADQVNEETLKLNEAEAAARARREEEENKLRAHTQTIRDISRYIHCFGAPAIAEVGRFHASNPERFHTNDLAGELDVWIATATAIKESIHGKAQKK